MIRNRQVLLLFQISPIANSKTVGSSFSNNLFASSNCNEIQRIQMLLQSASRPDCNTKGFQQVCPGSALKRLKRNAVLNHPNDNLQLLLLQFLKLLASLLHRAIQGNLLSNLHLLRTVAQVLKRSWRSFWKIGTKSVLSISRSKKRKEEPKVFKLSRESTCWSWKR